MVTLRVLSDSRFFLFFYLISHSLLSQENSYPLKNISVDQGLSHSTVVDIAQDSLGFMWFATQNGLNRYDGSSFKVYDKTFDFIETPSNIYSGKLQVFGQDLWMITTGGKLEVMNLVTDSIKKISVFENKAKSIPILNDIYIESSNRIWLGTRNDGVYLVNKNFKIVKHYSKSSTTRLFLSSNIVNKIYKSENGSIWILTSNGVHEITKGANLHYMNGLNALSIDEQGATFYVGTFKSGLFGKDMVGNNFSQARHYSFLREGYPMKTIAVNKALMKIWIGYIGNGLAVIDRKYGKHKVLKPDRNNSRSLQSYDIISSSSDNKGSLWFGTRGGGIYYYNDLFENFKIVNNNSVPKNLTVEQVSAIANDSSSNIWIATKGFGGLIYNKNSELFEPLIIGNVRKELTTIVDLYSDSSNGMWISTPKDGVIVVDEVSKAIENIFLKSETKYGVVNCFERADAGQMWAGASVGGLLLLNNKDGSVKNFPTDSITKESLDVIESINDTILALGYKEKGVFLFNTKTFQFTQLFKDFINKNLPSTPIVSLHYVNDFLWAGTEGKGILVGNIKTGRAKLFTVEDGIPTDVVFEIFGEDTRTLWMSSNKGIFKLVFAKENNVIKIESIRSFNEDYGLRSNEFKSKAGHQDDDGRIYFGGQKGLIFFEPDKFAKENDPFRIRFTEARIDNISIKTDTSIAYINSINLSPNHNSIAFNYNALSYNSNGRLFYNYKLVGYDEKWVEAGDRNYAAYTNLEPGQYQFKVKLADHHQPDNVVSSMAIFVPTPIWQTSWFFILIIILVLIFFYGLYKYRLSQILAIQKVKDNISSDLHDDLGARLTNINFLSAITRNKKSDATLTQTLNKIEKEIQASTEALDEIVWNFNVTEESLEDIVAKIRRYVSELLESDNIDYNISTPENFMGRHMKTEKCRALYLITKELINNVRKHAEATRVDMYIRIEGGLLTLEVTDNGKGFDTELSTSRNGLSNLKKRVINWRGKINICSNENGSTVTLSVPFDDRSIWQAFKRNFIK